jgi:hypothetical protein
MTKTTKPKAATPPKEQRHAVLVARRDENDKPDDATARTLTRPEVQAAAVIQLLEGDNHEVNALARELAGQVAAVNRGDMSRPEAILTAQAHTLDELFSNLARRSVKNMNAGYTDAADRYMRLALKSQSQCRTTVETLAEIKNPRQVAFVRQANIANGPQQVNNGMPMLDTVSRAENCENLQNKLLEAQYAERVDTGTTKTTIESDKAMATVGEIDRAEVKSR